MKSRSPAPGKKSALGGKKSEIQDLPPVESLPDGEKNYFVGGWSTEGSFATAVSRIALETKPQDKDTAAEEPMLKVAADLERGRYVAALQQPDTITEFTRTNIVILPGLAAVESAVAGDAASAIAEVTHGMFISGLCPTAVDTAAREFTARHPDEAAEGGAAEGAAAGDAAGDDEEEQSPGGTTRPKPRYEVTYRNPNAEGDDQDEEEEQVDEDGNPIAPLSPEDVAAEVAAMRAKGSTLSGAEVAEFLATYEGAMRITEAAQMDPQRLQDSRHQNAATAAGGTGFAKPKRPTLYRKGITVVDPNDLVVVSGAVTFRGIRPKVAVEAEAVTATRVATAMGVATIAPVDKSGKPKRKTEEEKQKEAEATSRLEQESQEAARAEEERLNAFAMPDRWPTVYVSNLAFAGPITVQGAHVRFYRCHFSGAGFGEAAASAAASAGAKSFLVTVNQYCRVEFCDCTFQQVANTSIYAYPASELYLQDCYFTRNAMPTTVDAALAAAVLPPQQSPFPCTGEGAIAIHADSAKLNILKSHFEGFGSAIVFRNKFAVLGRMGDEDDYGSGSPEGETYGVASEPTDEGLLPIRLRPALSTIADSVFINNSLSSLTFIDARRVCASRCYINDDACGGYYSVQVSGNRSTPQIMRCQVYGRILIGQGSRPFLHKNVGKVQLIDKNASDATYMSPKY